ncbi:hypothetical protein LCGC14_0316400 [marine sediment metagenome]|uniref:Transposase zinc-ribbon domain-containing protein n=1 Tax=marine sediment metagenome TaxID=412755 RepID=A0A0F9WSF1_9ZZZZ
MPNITQAEMLSIPPENRQPYYTNPWPGPYQGKPREEDILYVVEDYNFWKRKLNTHGYYCPNCEGKRVTWFWQGWYICLNCSITFSSDDCKGFYNVAEYEQDERPSEEDLNYILDNDDTDVDLYTM